MKQLLVAGLAAAFSAALAQVAHAGACAPSGWMAQILTPSDHAVPKNGAIVVGVIAGGSGEERGSDRPAVRPWKLSNDKKSIDLEVTSIAPGVATYRPKKSIAGSWKVVEIADGKETGSGVELGTTEAEPLAAPELASAIFHRSRGDDGPAADRRGSRTVESFRVTLAEAAPKEALGLVLYRKSSTNTQPALFTRLGSGTGKELYMWSTPGRCAPHMPNQVVPSKDDEVVAAWIDKNGLLSEQSAAIKVAMDDDNGNSLKMKIADHKESGSSSASSSGDKKEDKGGCAVSGGAPPIALVILLAVVAVRRYGFGNQL